MFFYLLQVSLLRLPYMTARAFLEETLRYGTGAEQEQDGTSKETTIPNSSYFTLSPARSARSVFERVMIQMHESTRDSG